MALVETITTTERLLSLLNKIKDFVSPIKIITKNVTKNVTKNLIEIYPQLWQEQMLKYEKLKEQEIYKQHLDSDKIGIELKALLKNHRKHQGCAHVFLLEYHNGTKNISTGMSYTKFDIKLDIASQESHIIPTSRYKGESILNYDILTDDNLIDNNTRLISIDDLKSEDRFFYDLVMNAECKTKWIVINNIQWAGIRCGCLVFLFTGRDMSDIDMSDIHKCLIEVERLNIEYVKVNSLL